MRNYSHLKKIFKRLSHLHYLQRILMWDEAVMMPEGAGPARAHALATLSRTMHKMLSNKQTKNLIALVKQEDNLSTWDVANLKWMEKKYLRASCIPIKVIEETTKALLACEQAWRTLRAKNNWAEFLPYLENSFLLIKEIANRQSAALQLKPYDTFIDEYAPGFNQENIDPIFLQLKNELPSLMQKIIIQQQQDKLIAPSGPFAIEKQKKLALALMEKLGFDFRCGRLDVSHHPFCSGGPKDVRVTTRYTETELLSAMSAICHETGHALYEQGLPEEWIDQPVGRIHSMAMHESQSLLMEMEVCRSQAFYEYFAPMLQQQFGSQDAFSAANLYKLAIRVKPGLIRVDADEVTYPLHIIIRYEIEKRLFNSEITIKDLPIYWNELMTTHLGLSTLENDRYGVMQDVHWPAGAFGYFPAYTLGRLMAAQVFATYKHQHADFAENFKKGNFQTLRSWLRENIYSYASSLSNNELLLKITNNPLSSAYFINHIKQRFLT